MVRVKSLVRNICLDTFLLARYSDHQLHRNVSAFWEDARVIWKTHFTFPSGTGLKGVKCIALLSPDLPHPWQEQPRSDQTVSGCGVTVTFQHCQPALKSKLLTEVIGGVWEDYIWFDCRDSIFCWFLYHFKTLCVREKMLKGKRVNQILCMNYLVETGITPAGGSLLQQTLTLILQQALPKISLAQTSQGAWQYLYLGRVNRAWHS